MMSETIFDFKEIQGLNEPIKHFQHMIREWLPRRYF